MQEADIRVVVEAVLAHLDGIYPDITQAIEAAKNAQQAVQRLSMRERERIIARIRGSIHAQADTLGQMGVQETGMGNVRDKAAKHHLLADKTPGTEDIRTEAWSGDRGLTLTEMGPFGVIGAITPSTNPSETVLCNTIGMLASGNTVVFNPHPSAARVSQFAVTMINEASRALGGPTPIAATVVQPSIETGNILMRHPDIRLLVATGGPGLVTAALQSGKRTIGAGAGNPPVLVDETADPEKAARDILDGCTFDNNLPCISEKEVVVLEPIAKKLFESMVAQGGQVLSIDEANRLTGLVMSPKGLNRDCVGKDAATLLKRIGGIPKPNLRCLLFEGIAEHPLIREEMMMPVLGIVRVKDFKQGLETCLRLEHGYRHSAHMHSTNVERLTQYGQAMDTAIFVKNAPSYAGIGFGGEGYCSFTIASRTGEGLTSAATFTRRRRCVLADSLCIR